ncbi:SRPBCC family protein [Lactiplantibacillus plantarum]
MKIQNSIEISKPLDFVFEHTNNVEEWPLLFTEYKKVRIIEKHKDYVKFELCWTNNEKENKWVSERITDREIHHVYGIRIFPMFPFDFMNIVWKYQERKGNTVMTWCQEFEPDISVKQRDQMQEFLDKQSQEQMKIIKDRIEKMNCEDFKQKN